MRRKPSVSLSSRPTGARSFSGASAKKSITVSVRPFLAAVIQPAGFLDPKCAEDLETIISSVEAVKTADFHLVFDPTLVRGMSYYTGPIFEISIDGFGGSVGGGGRYDEMIGRFTGQNTPACGFSVGFERIVMLLLEKDYQIPTRKEKKAFLIEKGIAGEALIKVFEEAKAERAKGVQVNVVQMKKNRKFQIDQLEKEGYTDIRSFYAEK